MKFKSSFQAMMWKTAGISFLSMICCFGIYFITEKNICYILGITSLTIFYHFAVRLFLGEWLLMKLLPEKMDYNKKWFLPRKFEKNLYQKLKVKKWKKDMPTYSPDTFSIEKHSIEEIIMETCKSEVVHECNIIASFVPLLFSLKFDSFFVFLLTSIGAACFDLVFVMMQRYNRPRLIRMIGRKR